MSPRGKEHNEQMRKDALEKILKGALKVFAEFGYYGTTMKRITEATALSYGLVYHYFTSKEEVFSYLVNLALEQAQAVVDKALGKEGTAWEKLTFLSAALLKEALTGDSALFFHIMLQAITQVKSMPELRQTIERNSETLYEKIMPLVIQAQDSGEAAPGNPLSLTMAYLALIQGLALFHLQDEMISQKITPDILLNVLRKRVE